MFDRETFLSLYDFTEYSNKRQVSRSSKGQSTPEDADIRATASI